MPKTISEPRTAFYREIPSLLSPLHSKLNLKVTLVHPSCSALRVHFITIIWKSHSSSRTKPPLSSLDYHIKQIHRTIRDLIRTPYTTSAYEQRCDSTCVGVPPPTICASATGKVHTRSKPLALPGNRQSKAAHQWDARWPGDSNNGFSRGQNQPFVDFWYFAW